MANNRIVRFEIAAEDPEALMSFYSELLNWQFQKAEATEVDYWLCETGTNEPGIDGAVMRNRDRRQPWLNYVDVASVDEALEKATRLGATVAMPKTPVPGNGAVAAIVDPEGNTLGLWERSD